MLEPKIACKVCVSVEELIIFKVEDSGKHKLFC